MKHELSLQCHLVGQNKEEISGLTKAQLTKKLKEVNEMCQLCTENNCECFQLGVRTCVNITVNIAKQLFQRPTGRLQLQRVRVSAVEQGGAGGPVREPGGRGAARHTRHRRGQAAEASRGQEL